MRDAQLKSPFLMAKLALLVLIINTSTLLYRLAKLAQEVEITIRPLKLATAQKQLLSSLVPTAFNVSYLNTSISKKKNAKHVPSLKYITFNQKHVYFVLVKSHLTMARDALNVVLTKDTTVLALNVKIAIMVESIIQLQSIVNAKTNSSSMMEPNALNASILNISTILKNYANNVLKIKFIISNSRNAFNVLKIIPSLMEVDALSALKIQFGMILASNVKPAKVASNL